MLRLFQTYLIEVLGVEYSTNEVVQSVQEKINNLFKKTHHINDLKFDTYFFYYSGLTLQDGSLVFSGSIYRYLCSNFYVICNFKFF